MSEKRTKRALCGAAHPMSDQTCRKVAGHGGPHASKNYQWATAVDIDQQTPGGGRVRLFIADIEITQTTDDA